MFATPRHQAATSIAIRRADAQNAKDADLIKNEANMLLTGTSLYREGKSTTEILKIHGGRIRVNEGKTVLGSIYHQLTYDRLYTIGQYSPRRPSPGMKRSNDTIVMLIFSRVRKPDGLEA